MLLFLLLCQIANNSLIGHMEINLHSIEHTGFEPPYKKICNLLCFWSLVSHTNTNYIVWSNHGLGLLLY